MVFIITSIIFSLDQWIKSIIRDNFYYGQSLPVLKDIFHLTFVKNKGAAFGILYGHTKLFIILSLVIVIFILIYRYFLKHGLLFDIATGLIIGGALGNLLDRIRFGYVIDYLDFRIWPVFNLADSAVVVGAVIILIYFWREEKIT